MHRSVVALGWVAIAAGCFSEGTSGPSSESDTASASAATTTVGTDTGTDTDTGTGTESGTAETSTASSGADASSTADTTGALPDRLPHCLNEVDNFVCSACQCNEGFHPDGGCYDACTACIVDLACADAVACLLGAGPEDACCADLDDAGRLNVRMCGECLVPPCLSSCSVDTEPAVCPAA